MNLKRWGEKEGFKRRVGCRLQMIGGSEFTGGASVFFQISHFIVVYNKGKRALGSRAPRLEGGLNFSVRSSVKKREKKTDSII